jgi:polyisoprenyl-phosphate glycosyltransferase
MNMTEVVSAVIPAFNEAERIAPVLQAVAKTPSVDHVILVDDGSVDTTSRHAIETGAVTSLIRHRENLGKGEAQQSGFTAAQRLGTTVLLFLDADMAGLTPQHVTDLVGPVVEGEALMTMGVPERTGLQRFNPLHGMLTGQRALRMDTWSRLPDWARSGYRSEAALNMMARQEGWLNRVRAIPLEGVTMTRKWDKEMTVKDAVNGYLKTYGTALLTAARLHRQRV